MVFSDFSLRLRGIQRQTSVGKVLVKRIYYQPKPCPGTQDFHPSLTDVVCTIYERCQNSVVQCLLIIRIILHLGKEIIAKFRLLGLDYVVPTPFSSYVTFIVIFLLNLFVEVKKLCRC